ncbi:PqiC family protein [Horticoccus luteus]|uniref:PqiC family protein n=1 Tax=Horticoccus luteus TaxID=2862869 RepID=A0A8F9TX13_9BACT|nr:PqiC family protein [Horticoccus luteus]QYM79551.1 PqiC family protein [Horticoccus luteus]
MKRFLLLAASLALFAGCNVLPKPGPDPTRYFVLTDSTPAGAPAEPSAERPVNGLVIGLRTLDVPGYLKSRSIVVRDGANEVTYQDYARWAEPLEVGLGRTLRLCLQDAGNVTRIYREPFPFDMDRDYDVAVRIVRCEGAVANGKGVARLSASIEILRVAENRVVVRKFFRAPEAAWDGKNFGTLARLLSDETVALGDAINAELAQLPKPTRDGK